MEVAATEAGEMAEARVEAMVVVKEVSKAGREAGVATAAEARAEARAVREEVDWAGLTGALQVAETRAARMAVEVMAAVAREGERVGEGREAGRMAE